MEEKLKKILILAGIATVAIVCLFLTIVPATDQYRSYLYIITLLLTGLDIYLVSRFFGKKKESAQNSEPKGRII